MFAAIDAERFKSQFHETRQCEIPDILLDAYAQGLYDFLNDEMSSEDWHTSLFPVNGERRDVPNTSANRELIQTLRQQVLQRLEAEKFCYQISRTVRHTDCVCLVCKTTGWLRSRAAIELFETVTGYRLAPGPMFASYYHQDTFLSPHTDVIHDGIAFVLNLSKNWHPHYGGNLHFLSEDWQRVIQVVTPRFNRLLIFDLVSREVPHFVSPVAPGISQKRLAITGWYVSRDR